MGMSYHVQLLITPSSRGEVELPSLRKEAFEGRSIQVVEQRLVLLGIEKGLRVELLLEARDGVRRVASGAVAKLEQSAPVHGRLFGVQ